MSSVPANLHACMQDLHGDDGLAWIEGLPETIRGLERRWRIRVEAPFDGLSYSYVAPASRGSEPLVLKLGYPGDELNHEAAALAAYAGRGAVRLYESDLALGALLLERLEPGRSASALDDDAGVMAAAAVMRALHRPVQSDHRFPTIEGWGRGFQRHRGGHAGGTGPLPSRIFELAEGAFGDLAASMDTPVLLHGDLHHANLLSAERAAWLAIDPKGVIGEPAYEVGAWLRNPMPEMLGWSDLRAISARRVDQFADLLGHHRSRVIGWGMAQAVLSGIWSLEDHGGGWEVWIHVAEVLLEMMGPGD